MPSCAPCLLDLAQRIRAALADSVEAGALHEMLHALMQTLYRQVTARSSPAGDACRLRVGGNELSDAMLEELVEICCNLMCDDPGAADQLRAFIDAHLLAGAA